MDNLKVTKETEQRIEQILSETANEVSILERSISEESETIEAAEKEMDRATAACDLKAYQAAKTSRRDAIDSKEMHSKRLEQLRREPLIPAAEYEKLVAGVYAELAEMEGETKAKLAKYSDAMNAAGLELQAGTEYANKILHKLQYEVFREADRRRNSKGVMIEISSETKEVDTYETIHWSKAGVEKDQYTRYTGRKIN